MDNIKKVPLLEQVIGDLRTYGEATNNRTIPGFDGLKSVVRRIMYAMCIYEKLRPNAKFVKSQSVIGTVMKTLHPHGDRSVYDAMVIQALWYKVKEPLVEPQGTFGTIQGTAPAAPRYTECRISKFGWYALGLNLLSENSSIIEYIDNFDRTSKEPTMLPIQLPLPLINGYLSIGYGVKGYIPNHNLAEVLTETIKVIQNPEHQVVLYPDPCQTCEVIGEDFVNISQTGMGSFKVRGIIDIEKDKKGNHLLIIKSTPDMVSLENISEKLNDMIKKNRILNVMDMIDETKFIGGASGKDVMRFVIKLKPSENPEYVREIIYKETKMEESYSVSFQLIDRNNSRVRMNYKSYIVQFIENTIRTKCRFYAAKLQRIATTYHAQEAYYKVAKNGDIDKIIKLIKSSNLSQADQEENLIKKFNITDIQARSILNTRIAKLSKMGINEVKQELDQMQLDMDDLNNRLANPNIIKQEIIDQLQWFINEFGKPRTSRVKKTTKSNGNYKFRVVFTKNDLICKMSIGDKSYIKPDLLSHIEIAEDDKLLIYDSFGKVHGLDVSAIPLTKDGININTLLPKKSGEIIGVDSYNNITKLSKLKSNGKTLFEHLVITKRGHCKRIPLRDTIHVGKNGIIYSRMADTKDRVIYSGPMMMNAEVYLSAGNKVTRYLASDFEVSLKHTYGRNMTKYTELDGASVLEPKEFLLVITADNKANVVATNLIKHRDKKDYNKALTRVIGSGRIVEMITVNKNDVLNILTTNGEKQVSIAEILASNPTSLSKGVQIIPKTFGILAIDLKQ